MSTYHTYTVHSIVVYERSGEETQYYPKISRLSVVFSRIKGLCLEIV
jgi:hypothetical protein